MKAFSEHPFHLWGARNAGGAFVQPRHEAVVHKLERELPILFHPIAYRTSPEVIQVYPSIVHDHDVHVDDRANDVDARDGAIDDGGDNDGGDNSGARYKDRHSEDNHSALMVAQ